MAKHKIIPVYFQPEEAEELKKVMNKMGYLHQSTFLRAMVRDGIKYNKFNVKLKV